MKKLSSEKIAHFCQLAHDRMLRSDYYGARTYLDAAAAAAPPPPMLLRLQGVCAAGITNFPAAIALLEAAIDQFRLEENLQGEVMVADDLAAIHQRQGDLGRAARSITWALDYSDPASTMQHSWLLNIAASVANFQGRFAEALVQLAAARRIASQPLSAWIDLHTATTLDHMGRSCEATAYLAAQSSSLAGDLISEPLAAYALVWHHLTQGDLAKAHSACQQALSATALTQYPLIALPLQATLGVLARESGELDRAEATFEQAHEAAHAHGDTATALGVQWHQAVLTWQRGDEQDASARLDTLLWQMQHSGYATTMLWQPDRFAELCAWAINNEIHNPYATWLIEHSLAPWKWNQQLCLQHTALLKALIAREQEVCSALIEGLTDGEIAISLGVSVRTVQNHLQHMYEKLGVRSRAAVVGIATSNPMERTVKA